MFGQIVKNAPQIVEGHLKEIAGKENDLSARRLAICEQCPLYTESRIGAVCDAKKCVTQDGNISSYPRPKSTCGCGCRLQAKSRLKNAKCVLGKW